MTGTVGKPGVVTQADLKPKQARIACAVYDNGRTPGSSDNTGGFPVGFIRYSWPFESKGIELNGQSLLAGQLIGPTTGWTPQHTDNTGQNGKDGVDLTTWVPYFNAAIAELTRSEKTCAAFARYPAPTWRAVKITSVDPCFVAGIWQLCRLDEEATYNVYPVLPEETIVKIWCREVETKSGIEIEVYDFDESTGEFARIEWPTWQPYQGATPEPIPFDCFIDCDAKFDPFIADNAVSNCTTYDVAFLCVFDADDNQIEQLAVFQWDCEGVRSTELYTLQQYNDSLDPNADPLDPTTDQYVLPEGASIKNCDGSDYQPPEVPSEEPCDDAQPVEICPRKEIKRSDPYQVCWFADGDVSNCDSGNVTRTFARDEVCIVDGTVEGFETTYTELDGLTPFDTDVLGEDAVAVPCIIDDDGNVLIGHETCYKYTVPKVVKPVKSVKSVKALQVAIKTAVKARAKKTIDVIRRLAVSPEDAPVALEFQPGDCLRVTEYCICGSSEVVQTTYELVENGLAIETIDGPIEVGEGTLWDEVPCDPRIEVVEEEPLPCNSICKSGEVNTDRNGINNPIQTSNFSGGGVNGASFADWKASLEGQGNTVDVLPLNPEAHRSCIVICGPTEVTEMTYEQGETLVTVEFNCSKGGCDATRLDAIFDCLKANAPTKVPCLTCSVLPYDSDAIFDNPIVEYVDGVGAPKPINGAPFSNVTDFAAALVQEGYSVKINAGTIEVCGDPPMVAYKLDDGTTVDATGTVEQLGNLVCDPNTAEMAATMTALLSAVQSLCEKQEATLQCLKDLKACDDEPDPCANLAFTVCDQGEAIFTPKGDGGPNTNLPAPYTNDNQIHDWALDLKGEIPECATGSVKVKLALDHENFGGVANPVGSGGHGGFILVTNAGQFVAGSETNGITVTSPTQIRVFANGSSPWGNERAIRCIELELTSADLAAGVTLSSAGFGSVSNGGEILHAVTASVASTAGLDCSGCGEVGDAKNFEASFKSSGLNVITTDKGPINIINSDFSPATATPPFTINMGLAQSQIQSFLDANGGGTVQLSYPSTSILLIEITGTTCDFQTADHSSNPGPHNFTVV